MKKLRLKRQRQEAKEPKEGKPKGFSLPLPPKENAKRALLLAGLLGAGALALLFARPKPAPPSASFGGPPESVVLATPPPPTPPVVQTIPQESTPPPSNPSPEPSAMASPAPEALPAPASPKPTPKNPFRLLEAGKPKEALPSKPSPPLPPPPKDLPPLPAPPPPAPQAEEERPKLVALTTPSPPGKPVAVLTWKGMKYTLALGEEVKGVGKLVKVETPCITLQDKKAVKVCLKEE